MVVEAVEEATLLVAVYRVVGRVEVEDDLLQRLGVGAEKVLDEPALDPVVVVADLLVALVGADDRCSELEPVELALARERMAAVARSLSMTMRQSVEEFSEARIRAGTCP